MCSRHGAQHFTNVSLRQPDKANAQSHDEEAQRSRNWPRPLTASRWQEWDRNSGGLRKWAL